MAAFIYPALSLSRNTGKAENDNPEKTMSQHRTPQCSKKVYKSNMSTANISIRLRIFERFCFIQNKSTLKRNLVGGLRWKSLAKNQRRFTIINNRGEISHAYHSTVNLHFNTRSY
jgi:hypothetical protein